MIEALIIAIIICIMSMYLGVIISKSTPDKFMCYNCSNNYVIVLICLLSLYNGRDNYIDIAYIYALYGFMVNLVITKLADKK